MLRNLSSWPNLWDFMLKFQMLWIECAARSRDVYAGFDMCLQ